MAAHLHLGAHQARHLEGHGGLVYGALWGKRQGRPSQGRPPWIPSQEHRALPRTPRICGQS